MSAGEPVAITTSFVNSFMSESQKGLWYTLGYGEHIIFHTSGP